MTSESKKCPAEFRKRGFLGGLQYAVTWVKQYWLNRAVFIILALLLSIGTLGYFNITMSGNVNTPIKVKSDRSHVVL